MLVFETFPFQSLFKGGPLLVLNGVRNPIHGLVNGALGFFTPISGVMGLYLQLVTRNVPRVLWFRSFCQAKQCESDSFSAADSSA